VITSAALIPAAPVFTSTERRTLAGLLAGYSGSLDRHATYIVAAYLAGAAR